MNRRAFLQIAGGMVVGAVVGGNAPNPVVLPTRPRVMPEPPSMPNQLAYEWGKQAVEGIQSGLADGSLRLNHEWSFYIGTALDPEATAEYDQVWEELHIATLRG